MPDAPLDIASIGEDVPLFEAIRTARAIRRLRPDPVSVLDPGFSVVVVVAGVGSFGYADGTMPVAAGHTLVVPYGAGAGELRGDVMAVRCRPSAA